jgi:hypothetical protein
MIATGAQPPAFDPLACAVGVIVPVVNLGRKSAWRPHGTALYVMGADHRRLRTLNECS